MEGILYFENNTWGVLSKSRKTELHPKHATVFLREGDTVNYRYSTAYFEPSGNIHSNRGSDKTVAIVLFNAYFVQSDEGVPDRFSYQGIIVGPNKEMVTAHVIALKPKVIVENLNIKLIEGVTVDQNFEEVSELKLV